MKFVVSTSAMLRHLQQIAGVVSPNSVLPVLENFYFDLKGNVMRMSATDLEVAMTTSLDVDGREDGTVAVPARVLLDTLKNLADQPLTFTINQDNFGIELTSETGKYKLAGQNGDDFPKVGEPEDAEKLMVPGESLLRGITHTIFAASNDEIKPAMTGILVEIRDGHVSLVGTDAHKLVRFKIPVDGAPEDAYIIPRKGLNMLKNSLVEEDEVIVQRDGNNVYFTYDTIRLNCRLIDGKYPDYSAVIPKDNPHTLTMERKDLLAALKRVDIYANRTTHQVVFNIGPSELRINAHDPDFAYEANESLSCVYSGDPMAIAFNARFLIEMLTVLGTGQIEIQLASPSRAGLVLPAEQRENEDILMLIMPVMLDVPAEV